MQTSFWQGIKNFIGRFFKKRMLLSDVVVTFDQQGITVAWSDGESPYVYWHEIQNIFIETTDEGPFYEDAWWCLGVEDKSIRIPNSAQGLGVFINELVKRGANEKLIIEAMGCTSNRIFLIWEKDKKPEA